MRHIGLTAFTVMLAISFCVEARGQTDKKKRPGFGRPNVAQFLKRLDKNGDGVLQRAELPPFLQRGFAQFDENRDGKLNAEETQKMFAQLRQRRPGPANPDVAKQVEPLVNKLMALDRDKDGKLSRKEAVGRLADNFDRTDANRDGFIDRQELTAAITKILRFQRGRRGFGRPQGPPDFDALDLDADGRLSRRELANTRFGRQFDQIDTDGSGEITQREFERFMRRGQEKSE